MQIKISNLKLKNFKGIKNLEINFEGKNANIYGKNATGKKTAGLPVLFKGLDFSSSGFLLGLRTRWVQCAASAKTVQ